MPIGSIISQPAADSLNAAYRPIVFLVSATATSGGVPPVVYCDIYVNGIYYKSQEKTQSTAAGWQFDIQDACQEVLKSFIPPNGGSTIIPAPANTLFATVSCSFRSSGFDVNGFITPEGTAPIQGTGGTPPSAGTGTASNSFYVVNSTLQHDQNQDLQAHLNSYKQGTWDAATYPLTHRGTVQGGPTYRVCENDSDYFPIISSATPTCITVFYTLKDGTSGSANDCGASPTSCPIVSGIGITPVDNGNSTQTFTFTWGTPSPLLTSIVIQYRITGSGSTFTNLSGSTASGRTLTLPLGTYDFKFQMNGSCNAATSGTSTAGIDPPLCVPVNTNPSPVLSDAHAGSAYFEVLVVTGDPPFTLSAVTKPAWMIITPGGSTHLTGTPSSSDAGTNIPVIFTLTNACGSVTVNTTIDVLAGVIFGATTFVSSDALNDVEIANLDQGIAGATVHVVLDTLTNTNGGQLRVNLANAFAGNSWDVVLDGSGQGSLNVEINGNPSPPPGTSVILGHFTITGVSTGSIGTPSTYQISRVF